jgi:hypothetical protein
LWETFEVEEVVASRDEQFKASGTGWQLAPPVELPAVIAIDVMVRIKGQMNERRHYQ